jgi:large subunit ribosomal protein L9
MEVLLLKDVPKLGIVGDTVRVSDGYARNFLIPRGLASVLTEGAKRQAAELKQARQKELQREADDAKAAAERLRGLRVEITAKAGEQGKLYGSVTSSDIAEALQTQHGVELDRRRILLEEPIRELGDHPVGINLPHGATSEITVAVAAE